MAESSLEQLKKLIAELFLFDQADLDFGLYRVLGTKRDELLRFVEHDLLPQVREALGELAAADQAALESGIFSDLHAFFRRYYQDGDFIAQRRYKEGVYAIPYGGEEVKLHWANAGQYYVKSAEHLRDYAFVLPDGRRVRFRLDTADVPADDAKAVRGQERRFLLRGSDFAVEREGELILRFEYRPDPERRKQSELNAEAARRILGARELAAWARALATGAPTERNLRRTLLDKHLAGYTARNTFDYFIHRDLGSFLRRELDFFIQNEVVRLDDLESGDDPLAGRYLARIRATRRIAHGIIAFLAQLEDFQRRLWLKKKLVVETHWCVTLDRVPEALYPEIAANDAQREEWIRLFAIDGIEGDATRPGYSVPLTVEFLKAHPSLVLDTRFSGRDFEARLLAGFADLDAQTDGVLVHGENFQALGALEARYRGQIDVVFIDPPYNTGVDGFPYKDNYQHSSWLSMMENRLTRARRHLGARGLSFIAIDSVEASRLRLLCDAIFGEDNFLADIAWEKRYTRSNNANRFYSLKDTILCYRASEALEVIREQRTGRSKEHYGNPDGDPRGPWISSSYVNPATRAERPHLVYAIRNPFTGRMVEHPTHAWKYAHEVHLQHVAGNRLYWGLDGGYEYPRLKSFLSEASEGMVPVDVWSHEDTGTTDEGGKILKDMFGQEVFDNPKPTRLVRRALGLSPAGERAVVLDFFAGSGTTGHAVIERNREDGGRRKYVLVEVGEHFDTVLKPRVLKAIHSRDWRDGRPISREGVSQLIRYVRLESYEDTLDNLELRRTDAQQRLLDQHRELREQYMLRYMLEVESRGSPSLLALDRLSAPSGYTLRVAWGAAGTTRPVEVDLVWTFNLLLGLRVERVEAIQGYTVVRGTSPAGERVLVIWRDIRAQANDDLETFFRRQGFDAPGGGLDVVYVNGDNNLEGLRGPGDAWKVRLIEEELRQRMFEVEA